MLTATEDRDPGDENDGPEEFFATRDVAPVMLGRSLAWATPRMVDFETMFRRARDPLDRLLEPPRIRPEVVPE